MTKALEEFRKWIEGVSRTRDGDPYPFTDNERNLMATAFLSGWYQGRTYEEEA